jgi:drug/metabolite transporter (DMT)-like permease
MNTEANAFKGILICLVGYFFVSLIGICEKSISHTVTVPTILFFQSAVCLFLTIPKLLKDNFQSLKPNHINTYLVRIISGLGCFATLFYIIRYIPISEALLYQYSASLWIPFIMVMWLGVHMPRKLWIGIMIGFLGIVLILRPSKSLISVISIVGILCGILQGISMVAIRKLSVTEPILRMVFYYFLVSTLVITPFAMQSWTPIGLTDCILLIGVGVSTYIGQILLIISLRYAHPSTLAPICYTSILYSGLLGWLFWHEAPTTLTVIGMILVISGCLLTLYMSRQRAKPEVSLAYEKT